MENRYTAARTACDSMNVTELGLGWYVRETHSDGQSSWIKCYCVSEATAWEIALALNHMDAITSENWRSKS